MSLLTLRAKAEIELRNRRQTGTILAAPAEWQERIRLLWPNLFSRPFAQRHLDLWSWAQSIKPGIRPTPIVAIWGRGGAKSTNAEAIVGDLGARKVRKYCWYVSGTQEKADSHVASIAAMFEADTVGMYYPELSSRKLGKYGNSKGWRRNRIRTESGITVDSLGLDTSARGIKIEEQRPDIIIFDDVDDLEDSTEVTNKKIKKITQSIMPSGSNDCVIMFIQNLIAPDSIASQLVDGRADFLADRIVSGPFPAVENLTTESRAGRFYITGGTATWAGQDLETCQRQMDDWGYSAFMKEAQHEVDKQGGIWNHIEFQHMAFAQLPDFTRTAVWVDPAVTSTDSSDSMGISAGGIDKHGMIYGLYFWEQITTPEDAIKRAIKKAIEIKAGHVGVETDQGGDTWRSVYARALASVKQEFKRIYVDREKDYNKIIWPKFTYDKAGAGYGSKAERNSKLLADYERGQVAHMTGTHVAIEKSLRRFPKKPLDLADSWFWTWDDLRNKGEAGGVDIPDELDW